MKLNDLYKQPLSELLGDMEITDIKPHSDNSGEVYSIEIKYVPKSILSKTGVSNAPSYKRMNCG